MRPLLGKLQQTYANAGNFLECMYFDESAADSWGSIARNFVLEQHKNHNLRNIVGQVMRSKIEIEREMRKELDRRILATKSDKLH